MTTQCCRAGATKIRARKFIDGTKAELYFTASAPSIGRKNKCGLNSFYLNYLTICFEGQSKYCFSSNHVDPHVLGT